MVIATGRKMSIEEFEHLYLGKRAELRRGEVREYMPGENRIRSQATPCCPASR